MTPPLRYISFSTGWIGSDGESFEGAGQEMAEVLLSGGWGALVSKAIPCNAFAFERWAAPVS